MYKDLIVTDYYTEVYGDVETILEREKPDTKYEARKILDKRIDEITGELTGSYDCNSWKAKEKVLNEMGMLYDTVEWFDISMSELGELFLNEYWETMDSLIRQYVYAYAVDYMIDEWFEKECED